MEPEVARTVWRDLEHLHAVTYFAPECRDAPRSLGLRGFWAGYFGCRAAPMGAVAAGVVEATFFNFHPDMVRKAIPDVWETVAPPHLVRSRAEAAAAALRRMVPDVVDVARDIAPLLEPCVRSAEGAGRVLFSANRQVADPDDPVELLWQQTTTLREHRGDGHVSLLTAAGLDGCEVHVLFAASAAAPADLYRNSRGWSEQDWADATDRLADRQLLDREGRMTEEGSTLRRDIEARTDELAAHAYATLSIDEVDRLIHVAHGAAQAVAAAELIPYPNPIGLPPPR